MIDEASESTAQTQAIENQEDAWSLFLSRFEIFMDVIDAVSMLNPYVKLAWSILSLIPKTILSQKNRNESIEKLCEKLKEVYDYITDAARLPELKDTHNTRGKTLLLLVQQTVECAYLIKEYGTRSIVGKVWKGGGIDDKIKSFNEKLDHYQSVITGSITLETGIVTLRIVDTTAKIADTTAETKDLILLNEMPHARDAGFVSGKQCLPGTRQALINDIVEWVNNDTSGYPQILLLTGQAGIGKSAVAHTIAEIFKRQNRLGSIFCFNRSYKYRCNLLFSTISRGLADTDALWRESLVKIIQNTAIRTSTDPVTQFNELIAKPSKAVATIGPVVIVIDALDESGDRGERATILDLLFTSCSELPSNYRFVVTSRPEQDIEPLCQNTTAVLVKRMGDIPINETSSDIQSYISSRLRSIASILDKIEGDWPNILAKRARGLFQWAETACRFIDPTVKYRPTIQKRWSTCVSDSLSSLYAFYEQIISSQPECKDPQFVKEFKVVVGALMVAREPLTINALQNILQDIIPDVQSILDPFGSLFFGVNDPSIFILPLHTSLFDFLNDRDTINNRYYISIADQSFVTFGCLKLMNRMLRFNICGLETSHLRNRDVPDFQERVKKTVPTHLSYACRFWALHLHSSGLSNSLITEICVLMDDNLLFWFEVLSLLDKIEQGCSAMSILRDWSQNDGSYLAAQASDAWHFGHAFKEAMTDNTPHLYISALPFTPSDSFISKKYLPRYPHLFRIEIGQSIRPDIAVAEIGITKSHTSVPSSSLSFSPRGGYIASGFCNGEIWLWDYKTGERVNHWKGQLGDDGTQGISDIVFSPDGELIYGCFFGITCVLVWNVKVDDIKHEFHDLDIQGLCHFCTISSDGQFIAFESDKQIFLCDRKNGLVTSRFDTCAPKDTFGLFKDKKRSAFSPNGNLFAFIGKEGKVHLWDNREQGFVATWSKSCCLALSDNYIAVLKEFSGITEVWSLATRKEVSFANLDIDVSRANLSVQFSANDQYVLSSCDNTFYVWILLTGELIHQSHVDGTILDIAFSPDLKYIALAIDNLDCTTYIRQWNAHIQPSSDDYPEVKFVDRFWLHGTYLVLVLEHEFLQIWDVTTTNTIVFKVKITLDSPVAIFSVNAAMCVAYVIDVVLANGDDRIIQSGLCLWNKAKGQVVLEESEDDINALAFSATANCLVSGYDQGTVKMWDVCACCLIGGPYNIGCSVKSLSFSQTNTKFLVAYDDQISGESYFEIRECQLPGRISIGPFKYAVDDSEDPPESSDRLCRSAVFSQSGRYIVGISENRIESFDAATGTKMNWPHVSKRLKRQGRLSPNGKYFAWTSYNEVILWDIENNMAFPGFPLNIRHAHTTRAVIYFSNDSTQIMTVTESDTRTQDYFQIVIWDVQTWDMIKTIRYPRRQKSRIQSFAFDDKHLVLADGFGGCPKVLSLHAFAVATVYEHNMTNASPSGSLPISYLKPTSETVSKEPPVENAETLDYALMAQNNASLLAFANTDRGWVLGPCRELLFWVPPERREGLWYPCMVHMPKKNITKLCFDKFVHGTGWTECKGTF